MTIGERIKKARELRKMSLEDLAEDLGAFKMEIKQYEDGTNSPGIIMLGALCDALNVTADWLLGRIPDDMMHCTKCNGAGFLSGPSKGSHVACDCKRTQSPMG